MESAILSPNFFNRDAVMLAKQLLGKVLCVKDWETGMWLSAQIVETEAYYIHEKASHSSLGFSHVRRALFMSAGTIYMYYARGGDSLNISAQGEGNAVLIKAGIPFCEPDDPVHRRMHEKCPLPGGRQRLFHRQCAGQTLLCKSLGLKVPDWNAQSFDPERFYVKDVGYMPQTIIETTRLGIPLGRDEHLPYRFVDEAFLSSATAKPR